MSPRTKKNLTAAMECDALDAAKYARFAARARMDDDWELARAFQETADSDRTEHFAKEAEMEGLIVSSPENLRNAIDAETREVEMFTGFARQATEDDDLGTASVFEQISRDKAERRARFEAVLADMGLHSNPQTVTG
jgi:rubrerythrin